MSAFFEGRSFLGRALLAILLVCALLPSISGQSSEASLQVMKAQAKKLESQHQFYNAIEMWQRVLRERPNNSQAYFGIARSYMRLSRYKEALGFVDRALLLANQNYQIGILKSRILMGLKQYDEAKKLLLELKQNYSNYEIDLALSELFAVLGDLASSVEYLNLIKEFSGENLNFLLTSLMVYEEAGKLDIADNYLRHALDIYYNEPVVHKVAAAYFLRRGSYSEVLEELDLIKRLGIDTEELRLLGLEAAYLKGDYQLASSLAETLVALYPRNAKAWYMLGLVYSYTMQMDKALKALNTARRIQPDNELVKIVIAEILRTRYSYPSKWHRDEAARYIASAQEKRDNLLYKAALQDYRFALQIDPLNAKNWMAFANVFRDRGNYAKYLDKLYSWKEFGAAQGNAQNNANGKPMQEFEELIRIYEASQPQSVASKWGLSQYFYSNNFYPTEVFVFNKGNSSNTGATRELGSYFVNILQWYEYPFVVGDIKIVNDRLQAQQAAYVNRNSDYYMILDFTSKGNGFRCAVSLYLSSTGRKIKQYVTGRVANGKIYSTFAFLAKELRSLFPKKAKVVETKVNRAVISQGQLDGVESGQKWLVLPESAWKLNADEPFGEYDRDQVVGTLTVETADEKVSEGNIQLRSLVSPVKKGYIALQLKEKPDEPENAPSTAAPDAPEDELNTTRSQQLLQEANSSLQARLFELN